MNKQTIFGEGIGNCFSTCIENILGITDVPNFCAYEDWPHNYRQWLIDNGYGTVMITDYDGFIDTVGLHIICGQSPRGDFQHAIVGYNGEPFFDPHPSNDFLVGDNWIFEIIFDRREP